MISADSVQRHVLGNGLTVLLRRDDSAPVAAVVTYVKAGYFDETDDVVGIAHVLEHMFFKGTPTYGVGEIARETKSSGGYLNAHTIYDHTSYYAVLPTEGFAKGLEIQADAYANSLIDAVELSKELEVIIQEAKRKADTPGAVATETLFELLHDRHRIRRWRIGREEGLRALTRDKLLAYYRNFYRPRNTILTIAGAVEIDKTLRRVEALYGGLDDLPSTQKRGDDERESAGFRYRELTGDIEQSHVAMGWRTPSALHPDTVYLDLLAGVLGRGRAGRLYRALRERRLASSVSADNYTPTEIGVFTLHAEGPAECARDAAAAMWGELAAVRESGVSEGEVERTQRLFEARWLRRLETMEGQANYLAEWESLGDWRLSEEYFDQMMSATAPQVTQVARQYLSAEEASFLVYRPKEVPPLASDAADARNALLTAAFPVVGPAPGKKRDGFRGSRALKLELERVAAGVHLYRSPSGVPILVRPRPGSPIVHFGVYSRVGAASEPDDVAGLATLATRAALKGTETRTAEEIAGESELLGGSIGSSVTSDGLGWTFSVPVGRVEPAVELLADVVQHPRYADESIETERVIALANLAELRDDMYRYPLRLATAAAYDGHPYGRGQLGTEESLHAIRAADVREWHRKSVMEAPTIIAVVGDVDALPAASLLAGAFDALSEVNVPEVSAPTWPAAMRQIVEEREKRQTALAVAFQGPARKDPARFAARLMATVASGLGGRFFETLREKQSLAYTVHAHAVERAAAGSFVAYIATSPEREEIARAGLLSEFERLRAEPVATKELDRAKTYTLGAHAIASQSGGAILGEMIDAWLYGSGLEELEEFEGRVRSVTVREMRDVAERYFDQERHVEGIVRGR